MRILDEMTDQDIVSELERLADLRERGAVSDAEFEAGKRALLGEPSRPARSRWTDPATLLPITISLVALGLTTYALIGSGPDATPPAPAPASPAGASRPADLPAVGDTGRLKTGTTACIDLQDYRKVKELAASDRGAADKHAEQACGAFEAGLAIVVERVSAPDGAVCARGADRGSTCFWIASTALAK